MTAANSNEFAGDLIDRIANALPVEVRADYYRELRHCRSLPESDEMLRILRAMQFSVVLMVQAPERMAVEREQLERILTQSLRAIQAVRQASETQQAQLDQRLTQLPMEIAKGISPEAVAATINESLRQQFVQSTIPMTAEALAVSAMQIKQTAAEFSRTSGALGNAYQGATEEARKAISSLESTSSDAISGNKQAAERLLKVFHEEYRWSLYTFIGIALVFGMILGMMFQRWLDPPPQPVDPEPGVQHVSPAKLAPKR